MRLCLLYRPCKNIYIVRNPTCSPIVRLNIPQISYSGCAFINRLNMKYWSRNAGGDLIFGGYMRAADM